MPLAVLVLPTALAAQAAGAAPSSAPWQFELKSSMTSHASPEESTRTTLRIDKLFDAPVDLLRIDVPYVNKNNDYTAESLDAGLGDVKVRVGFRTGLLGGVPTDAFLDVVFPTAGTETLGGGKLQLAPGASTTFLLRAPGAGERYRWTFKTQLQQFVSVAGPSDRKDINYTQAELDLQASWPGVCLLSLKAKPVVDWEKDGATASVAELKGTWLITPSWRAWLKVGTRLWGDKLPGTYDDQIELGVRFTLDR